jgi:phenylalanyl-tRNA synthetase alpha chain
VVIPGMVYRRDFFDASHAPAFAQLEGLAVDEGISFVDLKATLSEFARRFFGSARTRFRPSYFPFTEPSAEMDVQCQLCGGAGLRGVQGHRMDGDPRVGMVHPAVLESAGLDSERYTGWAFGMGRGASRCSATASPTSGSSTTPTRASWSSSRHDPSLRLLPRHVRAARVTR